MSHLSVFLKKKRKAIVPIAFIIVFGAIGTYLLLASHAQSTGEQASVGWTTISSNELENKNSDLCMGTPGTAKGPDGTKLSLQPCNSTKGQEWTLSWGSAGVSGTKVINGFGQCLDDTEGSASDGNPVQVYACNNLAASQTWTTGYHDGSIRIHSLCLGVSGNATSSGASIVIMDCDVPTPPPVSPPPTSGSSGSGPTQSGGQSSGSGVTVPVTTSQPPASVPQTDNNSIDSYSDAQGSLGSSDATISDGSGTDTSGTISTDGGDASSDNGGSITNNASSGQTNQRYSSSQSPSSSKKAKTSEAGVIFAILSVLILICTISFILIKKKRASQPVVSTAAESETFLESITSNMEPQAPASPPIPDVTQAPYAQPETFSTLPPVAPNMATAHVPAHHDRHAKAGEDPSAAHARLNWWDPKDASRTHEADGDNPPDMFEEGERRLAADATSNLAPLTPEEVDTPDTPAEIKPPDIYPSQYAQAGEDPAAAHARLNWWDPERNVKTRSSQHETGAEKQTDMYEEGRRRLDAEEEAQSLNIDHNDQ